MKSRYCLVALLLLFCLQNSADAKVILDKEMFYIKLNGKIDWKFGYAFQNSFYSKYKSKDKTSSYSSLRLLYLQRVYQNTQMGFNVKVGVSSIEDLKAFDIKKFEIPEGYFIIKNQGLGSIEYGKGSLVSQSILINTSKIYTAGGGVNGDWANYANLRGGDDSKTDCKAEDPPKKCDGAGYDKNNTFWVKPNIYSDYHGLKLELKQPVISYISPEFYNFQLGLSYVPGENNLKYHNLIGAGLSYKNSLSDDINFTAALTGEFARENSTDCTNETTSDLQCHNQLLHWNFGLNLKFFNLDWIFSYGNGGKSGRKLNSETNNTHYMNAGVTYHSDSRKLSLTYFTSGRDIVSLGTKELESYAISLEYPLAVGTSYYFDLIRFNTKEPKIENNNSGYVFLMGLKLDF